MNSFAPKIRDPLISIVMPVYNGGQYLVGAMASIIEQTHRDWEMICVNDGSTDASGEVLDWFAQQDPRIRVIHQTNAGIVAALNTACRLATAPLLCRMDCDDLALPHRLQTQAEYLRQNPTCTVVGGAILEMDGASEPLAISRLPRQHAEILKRLLTRQTGLFHPTTMFRTEAFEAVGGYRAQYEWVEDHDLWLRMAQRGRLANLPDVLLCYRQHASSVCWQRATQQRGLMNELLREAYRVRNLDFPTRLWNTEVQRRAAAGPGKWARAAAKGGFPRSVRKHLALLMKSEAATSYKARMVVEICWRVVVGTARRFFSGERNIQIPRFDNWQTRLAHSMQEVVERAA